MQVQVATEQNVTTAHAYGGVFSRVSTEKSEDKIRTAREQLAVQFSQMSSVTTIRRTEVKVMSEDALVALKYIAKSTRLAPEEKRALIRLVAFIDEFAGGNSKLLRDVVGVAKLMEMNAKQSYPPTPLREVIKAYFEEREKMRPSESVEISIETQLNSFSFQYLGVSFEEATAQAQQAGFLPEVTEDASASFSENGVLA